MQQFKYIFVLSLAFLAIFGVSSEDLIGKTCQSTPDSQICEISLRSDPRSTKADTLGLIKIMLDVVQSKFTDSVNYVNKLMKDSPTPVKAKSLTKCRSAFQFVLEYDVPEAKEAVDKGNPKFGVDAMRNAAYESVKCKKAIIESGGESTMLQRAKLLNAISDVATSMISTLL